MSSALTANYQALELLPPSGSRHLLAVAGILFIEASCGRPIPERLVPPSLVETCRGLEPTGTVALSLSSMAGATALMGQHTLSHRSLDAIEELRERSAGDPVIAGWCALAEEICQRYSTFGVATCLAVCRSAVEQFAAAGYRVGEGRSLAVLGY